MFLYGLEMKQSQILDVTGWRRFSENFFDDRKKICQAANRRHNPLGIANQASRRTQHECHFHHVQRNLAAE